MTRLKRSVAFVLVMVLIMPTSYATSPHSNLEEQIRQTVDLMQIIVPEPQISGVGGEWAVIGQARSQHEVEQSYWDNYYATVVETVQACDGVLHSRKYTEYSRVILALNSIGVNPRDVVGYDLVVPLEDVDQTVWQGVNGAIWALIALNSADLATDKDLDEVRKEYLTYIVTHRLPQGGWSLDEKATMPDPDITGMALQALAPYREEIEVAYVIEDGLSVMSQMQNMDGSFSGFGGQTVESVAQMIVALCDLGLSVEDTRFVKSDGGLWDALMNCRLTTGGFSSVPGGSLNQIATEQALCAMVAVQRYQGDMSGLYAMDDVAISASTVEKNVFPDVFSGELMEATTILAERGIINGTEDGYYHPDRTMTRAEFATILVRGLGLTPEFRERFSDVAADDWFGGYVSTAANHGIVNGVEEGRFAPSSTITNQQAAVMVARAANTLGLVTKMDEIAVQNMLKHYVDGAAVDDWAKVGIAYCYSSGILQNDDQSIHPEAYISRGEVAVMVYRMLNLANKL